MYRKIRVNLLQGERERNMKETLHSKSKSTQAYATYRAYAHRVKRRKRREEKYIHPYFAGDESHGFTLKSLTYTLKAM